VKILLAVDSSPESDLAVKAVTARPWPPSTVVEVINVVEPVYVPEAPDVTETLKERASQTVQAALRQLGSSGMKSAAQVLCGNVRGVIVEYARRSDTDLVVVGSHRATTMRQFLHGSVARAVVRFAPCSVEVVRAVSGAEGMKILLATDGSQCSEVAARSVAERPWPGGTEVRIISVADHIMRVSAIAHRPHFDRQAMERLEEEAMKHAQEAVRSAERIIIEGHLSVSGTVAVPSASPQESILKEASDWGAQEIVVGAHGHGGLTRLVLGSVSEAVATCALCSVEVIRSARR
jgi:nucleotide-binding universal stress UspA family protein